MEPEAIARNQALGRVGLGAALILTPQLVLGPWLGGAEASRPQIRILAAALGIRDLAIGAGTLGALARGEGARNWLRAGAAADFIDLAANLRARESLPAFGLASVVVLAAGSAATATWLQSAVD